MAIKDLNARANSESNPVNDLPSEVVIIPIVNSPIFPGMIAPIILSEDKYTPELDSYLSKNNYVALNLVKFKDYGEGQEVFQEIGEEEEYVEEVEENYEQMSATELSPKGITSKDVYRVGVLCKVIKKLKLPDGSVNLLVHGMKRYRAVEFTSDSPLLIARTEVFNDIHEPDEELDAYTRSVINQVKKLSEINPYFNEEMKLAMLNSPSPGSLADLVAFALSLDVPEAQDFLETLIVKKRFAKLLVYLKREKDVADIQKKITDEVNDKVNKYQREYFLREQLKVIRSELGLDEDDKAKDIKKIRESLEEINFPEEARIAVFEEVDRLESIPDSSPEYNVTRTYLNWMIQLPWDKETDDD